METIILTIDGMKCGMCEAHINNIIRKNFDVKKVKSSHKKNTCMIKSNNILDKSLIKSLIEKEGYKVLDIKTENE